MEISEIYEKFPLWDFPRRLREYYGKLNLEVSEMMKNVLEQKVFDCEKYFEEEEQAFDFYQRLVFGGVRGIGIAYFWFVMNIQEEAIKILKDIYKK